MATTIFLSYHHADKVIAHEVRRQITDLAKAGSKKDELTVFLDIETIPPGDLWKPTIDKYLQEANWLIVLFTGDQSDYVGYEVGTFEQMQKAAGRNPDHVPITCMHEAELIQLPATLSSRENVPVPFIPAEKDEVVLAAGEEVQWFKSDIGKVLNRICKDQSLYKPEDEDNPSDYTIRIALAAKNIANAFALARGLDVKEETPLQFGFEITFMDSPSAVVHSVPRDATVEGTSRAFAVLDINLPFNKHQAPSTTWAKLAAIQATEYDPTWMRKVEQDIVRAIGFRNVTGDDVSFLGADGKVYRPVLTRHQLSYSGLRKFFVLLIETPSRQFAGDKISSLLLAALILASRWRFTYFEKWDETQKQFAPSADIGKFRNACQQLLYNIEWIDNEAIEYGASDQDAMVDAFGPEHRAQTESFFSAWKELKSELMAALIPLGSKIDEKDRPVAQAAVETFLESTKKQNGEFMNVCLKAYYDRMQTELKRLD